MKNGRLVRLVRKIYSFIFCFSLILVSIYFSSSSAVAAENEDVQCINILDYSMPNDGSSTYLVINNSDVVRFNVPFNYGGSFFDILVETSVTLTNVSVVGNTSSSSLTFTKVDTYVYRIYGQTSVRYGTSNIGIQFTSSSTSNYSVNFLKFDVYTLVSNGAGDLGELNVTPNADTSVSPNYWYRQTAPGVPIVQDFLSFSGGVQFFEYNALISSVNWRKYDYLDFTFQISASTIDYISAYIKTSDNIYRYIPFEISFINGTAIDKNEYVGSGTTTVIPAGSQWDIVMRVYIPASYRLSGSLFIDVGGQYKNVASRCFVQSVNGYYYISLPSADLVKLDQIEAAIRDSLSSSAEDNAAAEDFSDNMTSQKEQMQANQDFINSVDKPSAADLSSIASPDAVLDTGGMNFLVSIIRPITDSKIVLGILTLSATLALVSYVFFGKKR